MSEPQFLLSFLLVLAAAAAALRLLSRSIPIPYQVVLAAVGLAAGLVPGIPLPRIGPDLILLAFVPGLVFEAALDLDLQHLRTVLVPVTLLATAGVAVTVGGIGLLTHLLLGLSWPSAFLLGAVVAATDPIAVVGILRRVGAPGGLSALLDGESLFNDGTGVALFAAILSGLAAHELRPGSIVAAFALLTAGGAAVGAAVGVAATLLRRAAREPQVEILVTLIAAYGSYLAADVLHVSGVVATVAAGIVVMRFSPAGRDQWDAQLRGFWSVLAFVLNAILFMLIGITVPAAQVATVIGAVAAGWLLMLVARAPLAYLMTPRLPWRWRHLALWGGVRGALGVALALAARGAPGVDPRVPAIAYGMIITSLLVQGGTMVGVARALRLSGGGDRGRP